MRFSLAAVLALATSALAQTAGFDPITKPTEGEKVPAGSTYKIVWQASEAYDGTISISLIGGSSPSTLQTIASLAKGVQNSQGSFEWAVSKSLGALATYGIQITWEKDPTIFQYGFPFQITGGSTGTESSSATGTTSASASASVTPSGNRSSIVTSSTLITSSTLSSNLSTTARTTKTTVIGVATTSATRTSTSTSSIPTGAAANFGASSFALFGGLAMAVLAL